MYSSSKFVFFFCKVMGVAPIKGDKTNGYQFSVINFGCNIAVLTCLILVGLHALFSDYKNTFRGKSVRMKSRTAVVVTFLEFFLNVVVFSSGIVGAAFNYKTVNRVENIVEQMDEKLSALKWCAGSGCNFAIILAAVLLHHIVLIYVDVWFWFHITPDSWSYAVCYVYVFVEIAIEAQFSLVAWHIKCRFKKINQYLAKCLRQKCSPITIYDCCFQTRSAHLLSFETFQTLHWSLCQCIKTVNSAFGWQMLTSILCICVHILVTPYFLLLDLFYPAAYGSADIGFLALQVLWIITHHIHLLLIVIPASAATDEAKRTSVIICENLSCAISPTMINKFETFVSQLNKCNVQFSACGLFHLQRPVITSLIGTVVTYLVILIQFQNSDKVYH